MRSWLLPPDLEWCRARRWHAVMRDRCTEDAAEAFGVRGQGSRSCVCSTHCPQRGAFPSPKLPGPAHTGQCIAALWIRTAAAREGIWVSTTAGLPQVIAMLQITPPHRWPYVRGTNPQWQRSNQGHILRTSMAGAFPIGPSATHNSGECIAQVNASGNQTIVTCTRASLASARDVCKVADVCQVAARMSPHARVHTQLISDLETYHGELPCVAGLTFD